MKKTYIKPTTTQYKIMGKQVLLGASFSEDLGTNGVNGNEALSRGGDDFWDDEE